MTDIVTICIQYILPDSCIVGYLSLCLLLEVRANFGFMEEILKDISGRQPDNVQKDEEEPGFHLLSEPLQDVVNRRTSPLLLRLPARLALCVCVWGGGTGHFEVNL